MDPVTSLNLVFDIIIFILGLVVYSTKKSLLSLWVAVAFLLFAISYALTIAGAGAPMILIPLRTIGYICVIVGLILQRKH
jgi:hypothetical protein